MAGSSSATEATSHNQNGLIKNQTRKGKERAMQEEQSVDDNLITGYVSDEQPSDLLVSKAVKLIRNKANLPKRDTYLERAVEEYGTNHPNHLFAKQPHSILYPSLYSGPSHHFHLQPQFQYKSTPDTTTWLNQMEWIVEGGKNGIPDGNEDRRRGLRGHQQRRGKGLDSQLKSYRKLEKERKDRIKEDDKWKQDYDQGRIDQGKKPYFSRRKRPDPSSDEDGNRVRIHETPELSDDDEERLALLSAPGRPDFFRRRLENSPFPVNLLRLYDEIQEWSSSSGSDLSEDEDCRMGTDFPANEQEAMRLHLKRKEVRKRRRLQRDRTDKLGNSQSHKSRSSQIQQQNQSEEKENDGDVDEDGSVTEDSLLHPADDEAQPQGGGAVDGMNLDEREVVPTSDREEALSEILSDQDFSNSMRKEDSDTSAELEVAAGAVEDEEMNLVQRQEADWDKEDQERQRHTSKTPSISQYRSQRSDQPPASGSKSSSRSGGGKEKEPSESISARRDSNASSTQRIPFAASPKSQSKSSYPAPSHSTPIRKSQGSSKNKGSNSLPPSQTQKSTSSSRRQGPSSSLNNQMEEDAPVQEPQAPNRSQDERNRIIAIAQATTTSQSTFDKSSLIDDPRFESHNLNTTSMTQPTTRTNELTKASSSRRGPSSQTSGRGNGKASSAIDLQKEKERVRNERQVERNDDKGKEREDEEEEEEEVDQLDSLQSRSESQPQAILEKKQAEPQDDFDRFLTKDANSKNKGRPTASSIMEEDDRQKSLEQEGADDARQTPKGKGKAVIGTSGVGSTTPSNSVSKPTTPRSALQPPFRPRPSNQPISPFQQTETMVTLNSQSPDVDHRFGKGEPTFRVTSASSPNPNRSNRDESQRSNASSSRLSNKSKSQTDNPGSSLVDTPPRTNKGSNLNPNKDSSLILSSPSNKNQLTPSKLREGDFLSPTSSRSSSSKKHGSNRSYSSHTSLLMATALQGSPSIRERNNSSRSNGGGLDRSLNQPQAQNLDESLEEDQLDDREPTPTLGNQEQSRSSSNHQVDEDEEEHDVSTTSIGNISNSLPTKLNKSPSSSSKSSPLGRNGKVSSLSQSLMNSSKNKRRVEDSEKSFKKKNSSGSGSSSSLKKAHVGSQEGSGRQQEKRGGMESLGDGNGTAKSSGNSVYFTGSNGGDGDVDVDVEDESSSPNSSKGKKRAREGNEDRTPKRKKGDEDGGSVMRMLGLQEEDEAPSPSAVQVQKEL